MINNQQEHHVIFGTGPVGRAIATELSEQGKSIRMINRSGRKDLPQHIEVISGDAKNHDFTRQVTEGASHVYFALNPAYHRWLEEFPLLQDSVLQAAIANRAKLIAMENLYMYGDTHGKPMTEDMPFNAHTRKGKLRAQMHEQLMLAHTTGKLQVVTGRASDFFGPHVRESAMGERVFGYALQGKKPQLFGDVNTLHTQTYMKDIGKALVLLAQADDAYGQAWHLPNPRTVTQKKFIDLIAVALNKEIEVFVIPKLMVRILALFIKPLGEVIEMLYEFEQNFIVDSSKFERQFGNIATPLEEAIQETVNWYRDQHN